MTPALRVLAALAERGGRAPAADVRPMVGYLLAWRLRWVTLDFHGSTAAERWVRITNAGRAALDEARAEGVELGEPSEVLAW